MIKLSTSDQNLQINKQGFIIQWSGSTSITPEHYAYPVVFKEYSRENPFCRSLDVTSFINVNCWDTDSIKFTKIIENFEEKEGNLLQSLLLVVLSGAIFLLGVFIAGDLIYSLFYEQFTTFILEQITGGFLYGFGLSKYDYL